MTAKRAEERLRGSGYSVLIGHAAEPNSLKMGRGGASIAILDPDYIDGVLYPSPESGQGLIYLGTPMAAPEVALRAISAAVGAFQVIVGPGVPATFFTLDVNAARWVNGEWKPPRDKPHLKAALDDAREAIAGGPYQVKRRAKSVLFEAPRKRAARAAKARRTSPELREARSHRDVSGSL